MSHLCSLGHHPLPAAGWLPEMRDEALQRFRQSGLPGRHDEAWKYTSVFALGQREYQYSERPSTTTPVNTVEPLGGDGTVVLTVAQGMLAGGKEAAVNSGLIVCSLADAVEQDAENVLSLMTQGSEQAEDAFVNLNQAYAADGLFIQVAKGVTVAPVVEIIYTSASETVDFPRNLIILEAGARLTLIERFSGFGPALTNLHTTMTLGEGAQLEHLRVQTLGSDSDLVTRSEISQQAESSYRLFAIDSGGQLVRHDTNVFLNGCRAKTSLNGAYLLDGAQHVDNHTRVDHIAKDTHSDEVFKGVVDEQARAVFNGKVVVHPGADGTQARQSNGNILLSPRAEVDTKPELEIYADDVVCSHGATVGQLDEEALFYLRARGVPEAQATRILTDAFCREALDGIMDEGLRERVIEQLWRNDSGTE